MLGINLLFAGFALTLNGVSYITEVDNKAKGLANCFVGLVIGINAVFQVAGATNHVGFGFSAAMWLFALNYLILGAHLLLGSVNWKVFGLYSLFASLVSFIFAGETIVTGGPLLFVYLWGMWAILWLQSFLAVSLEMKQIDKFTPHILIINGIASTFIPGFLMLFGIL
jgi:hypothetical protein